MATVKGDVHDIGKNIVGVVLGCNDYEVIDLGVMVPVREDPQDGPRAAGGHDRPVGADHAVARRDGPRRPRDGARRGSTVPLLIGGATTSAKHTAVQDRAGLPRAGGPRQGRLALRRRGRPPQPARAARRARPREPRHAGARARELRPAPAAQARAVRRGRAAAVRASTGPSTPIAVPAFLGHARALTTSRSAELVPYIDWSPFFMTWELKGKYPRIFDDPEVGAEARELFDDAPASCSTGSSPRSG